MILEKLNHCPFCNSKSIFKSRNQDFKTNFYVDAIISDLKINTKLLSKIKTYECEECFLRINNPWFNESISRKIYSNIYGQHNNSWQNLINFINKKELPNHGDLFNMLSETIKIKNYAEYNSPFMGLFINFFHKVYSRKSIYYKHLHSHILKYLSSRQLAGSTTKKKK